MREPATGADHDPPMQFRVATRALGRGRVCVAVEGELDLANAETLKLALQSELAAGRRVLLDLSKMTFIDSTGLAAIVNGLKSARKSGGELELRSQLRPQARRLMELTGVLPMLSVED